MTSARERIGDMLVIAGLITQRELDEALEAQKRTGLRIGKQLVELGYVAEAQLTQILSNQLSIPWVSLDRIEFSSALLDRLPGELADNLTVMPVYVRTVRDQGDTLYVAMDDPTDEDAIRLIARAAGLPVRPMISAPTELRRAIEARYFGADDTPSVPSAAAAPATPATPADANPLQPATPTQPSARNDRKAKEPRVKPPPPPQRVTRPEGVVAVEQYEVPSSPPRGTTARTLTFLDGTRISLPAGGRASQSIDATEVRHVIKAVRRAAADLGLEEAPKWHDVVQILLDALAKRGIKLTRKEIQEAWAKRHGSNAE